MLSDQEVKKIKEQLLKQLDNLPDSQKADAQAQIESLSTEQLEEFLKKNNLLQEKQSNPFRLIIQGKIPSYKILENSEAISILEINPVSKGHCLIIQKNPKKELSEKVKEIILNTTTLIEKKLSPKNVLIEKAEILGELVVNLIPVYNNENLESERKKASQEELQNLQQEFLKPFEEKPAPKPVPTKPTPLKKLPKAPKRIP
jgi:diadenosine tetraphosphate (Ap4A) HIT family hydrolase